VVADLPKEGKEIATFSDRLSSLSFKRFQAGSRLVYKIILLKVVKELSWTGCPLSSHVNIRGLTLLSLSQLTI